MNADCSVHLFLIIDYIVISFNLYMLLKSSALIGG